MARRLRDNAVSTADARVQLSSDAADRENDPYIGSTDVGMIGLQDDDDSAWLLRKFNPNEWLKFKFQDQVAAEIDVGATGGGFFGGEVHTVNQRVVTDDRSQLQISSEHQLLIIVVTVRARIAR